MYRNRFMEHALDLAFRGMGKTSPNPSVGAVIVKNNEIISSGTTCSYGCDHAEVVAINNALSSSGNFSDAEMYVTLEPCCHHGKTPPCTDLIIRSGIKKVFSTLSDPNPDVAGKGFAELEKNGISVEILKDYAESAFDLIRPFRKKILCSMPFVISKAAVTLDGRISTQSGDSKWISNCYSRFIVHKYRSRVDAIVIGVNTFLHDKPSLDVRVNDFPEPVNSFFMNRQYSGSGRYNYFMEELLSVGEVSGKNPLRVIIGFDQKMLNEEYDYFFEKDNYLILAGECDFSGFSSIDNEKKEKMNKLNIRVIESENRKIRAEDILECLNELGIMSVMLEGGSQLNSSFFDDGFIDQFVFFITPKLIGSGRNVIDGAERQYMKDALLLKDLSVYFLGDGDILYCGYNQSYGEVS